MVTKTGVNVEEHHLNAIFLCAIPQKGTLRIGDQYYTASIVSSCFLERGIFMCILTNTDDVLIVEIS